MRRKSFSCGSWSALEKSVENRTVTNDLLLSYGIITHTLKMPAKLRGYTEKYDDIFLIYINADHCVDCQWMALTHELKHIIKNDFCHDYCVDLVEAENK